MSGQDARSYLGRSSLENEGDLARLDKAERGKLETANQDSFTVQQGDKLHAPCKSHSPRRLRLNWREWEPDDSQDRLHVPKASFIHVITSSVHLRRNCKSTKWLA